MGASLKTDNQLLDRKSLNKTPRGRRCAHLLQEEHQDGDEGGPLLLQREEAARRAHEQLGVAVRHVVLEAVLVDDHLHRLSIGGHQVVRPSVLARHLVPVDGGVLMDANFGMGGGDPAKF